MLLAAVGLKVVVAEPAGTVIEAAGAGSSVLLLDKETAAPPAGAAWLRVTVQVALVPGAKLVGLQEIEDKTTGATRLIVAVCETPLRVAVSVAL